MKERKKWMKEKRIESKRYEKFLTAKKKKKKKKKRTREEKDDKWLADHCACV